MKRHFTISPYILPGLTLNMDIIIHNVCNYLAVSRDELNKKCRKKELVFARQMVYYFSHQFQSLTSRELAYTFYQDHATVYHSMRKITQLVSCDHAVRKIVSDISLNLGIMTPLPTTAKSAKDALEKKFLLQEFNDNEQLKATYQAVCDLESVSPEHRLNVHLMRAVDELLKPAS